MCFYSLCAYTLTFTQINAVPHYIHLETEAKLNDTFVRKKETKYI